MLEKYDENKNPAAKVRISWRQAWSSPSFVIATFFGSGAAPKAPGTWGTLAGLAVYVALAPFVPAWGWLAASAALFAAGVYASDKVAQVLGVEDCGSIVVDEVAAVWLVALVLPQTAAGYALAFVLFRFFDIIKLPPVSYIDEKFKNGFGVMIDDVFAAAYAAAAGLAVAAAAGL